MKLLLIDTETNGLPTNRFAPASEWRSYPAILQLSWLIYEPCGSVLGSPKEHRDISVELPASDIWNTGAAAIHGIPEKTARSEGIPAAEALMELYRVLRTVDCVCAHNLSFDRNIIRAAAYAAADRGGPAALRSIWPAGIAELCTMNATRDLLQLAPGPLSESKRWKAPRLGELYQWLYRHVYDISGAILHTARSDTHCLSQCLEALMQRGLLSWSIPTRSWVVSTATSASALSDS
jgi:hypothetical protein